MLSSSLVVVGSGIKFLSHLTTEAKVYIEQSDRVLYLVNEPAIKEWIQSHARCAESLDPLYTKYPRRLDCYRAITEYILLTLEGGQHICVVVYGHPTVFAKPALDAVILAKQRNIDARILPGISAEDCLFADLMIDPGSCGCQSFEATDFLVHQRKFDPNSHLLLWQVGIIGVLGRPLSHDNTPGMRLLHKYLRDCYDADHQMFSYVASQYPHLEPKIDAFSLKELAKVEVSRLATLYIPPADKTPCDSEMLEALDISLSDLM